nr:hypothetical protein [Heyndrickxia oleronia]
MEPGKLLERHFISIDTIQKLHQMAIATYSWFWGYSEQGLFRKRDWPANFIEQHWMKFGLDMVTNQLFMGYMKKYVIGVI